jgi:hypothetical protein
MKLLLDTPEHIWRLLEKKKYLHAGWLFLLARIIYQALVRDDNEDEDDWIAHGIIFPVCRSLLWLTGVSVDDVPPGAIPSRSASVGHRRAVTGTNHVQSDSISP